MNLLNLSSTLCVHYVEVEGKNKEIPFFGFACTYVLLYVLVSGYLHLLSSMLILLILNFTLTSDKEMPEQILLFLILQLNKKYRMKY